MKKLVYQAEVIENKILLLRGHRVLLDTDLAKLYGVTTKQLNQQVKRNLDRFPSDFMFRLNKKEKNEVVTICDHLKRLKFSSTLPHAFSEHGALMLASVLNSPRAVQTSIQVVRAFVRMRRMLAAHADLLAKLRTLEQKYDAQFGIVFKTIRKLLEPPAKPKGQIGFKPS